MEKNEEFNSKMNGKSIIFDVETTGLPIFDGNNYYDYKSLNYLSSRVVEIAYFVMADDKIVKKYRAVIFPKFEIPKESVFYHGITTEMAKQRGIQFKDFVKIFEQDTRDVKSFIGFNVKFDRHVLAAEFYQQGFKNTAETFYNSSFICAKELIQRKYDLYTTKLSEAYYLVTGLKDLEPHKALNDVEMTLRVYEDSLENHSSEEMEKRETRIYIRKCEGRCLAPKKKSDPTIQCPSKRRGSSIFCGIHINSERYKQKDIQEFILKRYPRY